MGSEVRAVCCQETQRNHQGLALNMHIPMETSPVSHLQGPCAAAGCYSNRQDVTLLHNMLFFLLPRSDLIGGLFSNHVIFSQGVAAVNRGSVRSESARNK